MADLSDADRFRVLFDQHWDAVWRFAVRRASPSQAEDVTAEAFEIAWRKLDEVPTEWALPWLYVTARNLLANLHRRERHTIAVADPAVHHRGAPSDGGAVDEADLFARALARLSDRDREVLSLAAWEQLCPADAARVLGCTAATYRVRLHRARRRLRAALDRQAPAARATEVLE